MVVAFGDILLMVLSRSSKIASKSCPLMYVLVGSWITTFGVLAADNELLMPQTITNLPLNDPFVGINVTYPICNYNKILLN